MKKNIPPAAQFIVAISFYSLMLSCKHEHPPITIAPPSLSALTAVLDNSAFTLFNRAAKRLPILDSLSNPKSFYTIFAPTDSAMRATGLSESAIDNANLDSLQKLINYHIVVGSYSVGQLTGLIKITGFSTARRDYIQIKNIPPGYDYYPYQLYISYKDSLRINDRAVNHNETPIAASNGYIYPLHTVLPLYNKTLYETFRSRPELSLYATAIHIISILYSLANSTPSTFGYDSSAVDYFKFNHNLTYHQNGSITMGGSIANVTVFAPTNTAFINAGLGDSLSIVRFCKRKGINSCRYVNLDSALKVHVLTRQYFIQDLITYPYLSVNYNNANRSPAERCKAQVDPFLDIKNDGTHVTVAWNAQYPAVTVIDSAKDIITTNGVIHEVNQLFYPL